MKDAALLASSQACEELEALILLTYILRHLTFNGLRTKLNTINCLSEKLTQM